MGAQQAAFQVHVLHAGKKGFQACTGIDENFQKKKTPFSMSAVRQQADSLIGSTDLPYGCNGAAMMHSNGIVALDHHAHNGGAVSPGPGMELAQAILAGLL